MAKTSGEAEKLILQNYSKLLSEIKNCIADAKTEIFKVSVRQKVVISWQIGRLINENLLQDARAAYGKHLFEQLQKDLQIKKRSLYKMQAFHKAYPKLPKDDERLNWSHYRVLAEIKNINQRKYLENLVIENQWSVNQLETAVGIIKNEQLAVIKNEKENAGEDLGEDENENDSKLISANSSKNSTKKPTKLTPKRGQLYSYPLVNFKETNKFYLDLGFNIFREVVEELSQEAKNAAVIEVKKIVTNIQNLQESKYLLQKSAHNPTKNSGKFNTYKAFVERVVDGDTLRLIIDLGFGILHKEIIRLRGINASEIATNQGEKSSEFLTELMKKIDFVVIKTTMVDIYGRFVADVFFDEKNLEGDPQKIANQGVYLNQLLLDEGMAEMF